MKQISRSAFYEKVWTTPISRLSKEFGIFDVISAKVCKKDDIPSPPKGYCGGYRMAIRTKDSPQKGENRMIEFDVESNQGNHRGFQLQKENEEKSQAVKPAILESEKNYTSTGRALQGAHGKGEAG